MERVALEGRGIRCERDDRVLFEALDLFVGEGALVRIEGPNGSGKTTLLKVLSAQLTPHSGSLHWRGAPLADVREDFLRSLLYIGHTPGLSATLTARENLIWAAALAGLRVDSARLDSALDDVGLCGFEDLPAGQLSAGQQRRIALARLVLMPRPLWILDEPFTAIDRSGVEWLEHRLTAHCESGGGVVMTTHHVFQTNERVHSIRLAGQN